MITGVHIHYGFPIGSLGSHLGFVGILTRCHCSAVSPDPLLSWIEDAIVVIITVNKDRFKVVGRVIRRTVIVDDFNIR